MVGILAVIYVVFISLGLPDSLFGVSWPVLHLEFALPESYAAVFSAVIGFCTSGTSLVAGKLIRRLGTGRLTFYSILLTVFGMIGISLSPNLWVMMFFSVIMGYGAGAIDTALNNYVSLHYEAKHMNWLHCFWGLGVSVSPMIMSAFLGGSAGGWRRGYAVVAVLQLAIALLVLLTLNKWKTGGEAPEEKGPGKSFLTLMKEKGMLTSILSLGLYCGGESILGTWGASFAVNTLAVAPEVAAKWVSLYYAGIMAGRVVSGFVSVRLSDDRLIRAGLLLSALGVAVLALPVGEPALLGLFFIGFGYGPVFPGILHSVPARFGTEYSADITGYHMGIAYFTGLGLQVAFGLLATEVGFALTPGALLLLCAGMLATNEMTVKSLRK